MQKKSLYDTEYHPEMRTFSNGHTQSRITPLTFMSLSMSMALAVWPVLGLVNAGLHNIINHFGTTLPCGAKIIVALLSQIAGIFFFSPNGDRHHRAM